jgi:hypothetical protein
MGNRTMAGVTDLDTLLASMEPVLQPGEFVFCSLPAAQELPAGTAPLGMFREQEGMTAILEADAAVHLDCPKSQPMRCISLTIHSSLEAVGLTAAISTELTRHKISANVVAGFYHDHIFVRAADADRAQSALRDLSRRSAAT